MTALMPSGTHIGRSECHKRKAPPPQKKVADGHERRPLDSDEEFSLSNSAQSPGELLMDLYNNHVGRRLFVEHSNANSLSPSDVVRIVREAQRAGRLQNLPFHVTGR